MEDSASVLLAIGLIALGTLIGGVALRYSIRYSAAVRHAKLEMCRAQTRADYIYWRRERNLLRLCIIPGLTPRRLRTIRRFILPAAK